MASQTGRELSDKSTWMSHCWTDSSGQSWGTICQSDRSHGVPWPVKQTENCQISQHGCPIAGLTAVDSHGVPLPIRQKSWGTMASQTDRELSDKSTWMSHCWTDSSGQSWGTIASQTEVMGYHGHSNRQKNCLHTCICPAAELIAMDSHLILAIETKFIVH